MHSVDGLCGWDLGQCGPAGGAQVGPKRRTILVQLLIVLAHGHQEHDGRHVLEAVDPAKAVLSAPSDELVGTEVSTDHFFRSDRCPPTSNMRYLSSPISKFVSVIPVVLTRDRRTSVGRAARTRGRGGGRVSDRSEARNSKMGTYPGRREGTSVDRCGRWSRSS